jgi:hypothetical protein
MKIVVGQRLIKKKGHGKPDVAYVIDTNHPIKLSEHYPYITGSHTCFFINKEVLHRFYEKAEIGTQSELFPTVDKFEYLRKKHFK